MSTANKKVQNIQKESQEKQDQNQNLEQQQENQSSTARQQEQLQENNTQQKSQGEHQVDSSAMRTPLKQSQQKQQHHQQHATANNYQYYQSATINNRMTANTQHTTGAYQPHDASLRDTSYYNSNAMNKFRTSQFAQQQQPLYSSQNQNQQSHYLRPNTSAAGNGYERRGGSPQRIKDSQKRSSSSENKYQHYNRAVYKMPNNAASAAAQSQTLQNKENYQQQAEQHHQPAHQDAKQMAQNSYITQHYNVATRDAIAATYRQEIHNLKQNERDFAQLIMIIQEAQKRNQMAEYSLNSLQQDNERQLQAQVQVIEHLTADQEAVKKTNFDHQNESGRLQQQVQETNKEIHNAEIELYSINQNRDRVNQHNNMLEHDIDCLKNQIKEGLDFKSNQQQKIYELQQSLHQVTNDVNSQDNKVKVSKTELDQLIQSEHRLAEVFQQKSVQFDDEAVRHEVARTEIQRLVAENHCLETDVNQAKNRNTYLLDVQREMIQQRDSEAQRGGDLSAKLKQHQHKLSVLEGEAQALNQDIDATKHSNDHLLQGNSGLKEELAALQKHANLIQLQNKDLQRELDEFVITDDIIRSGLDRREKVNNIRQRVETAIQGSQSHVDRSKSPMRRDNYRSSQYDQQAQMQDITNVNNHKSSTAAFNYDYQSQAQDNNRRDCSPIPYKRTTESKGSPLRSSGGMNNY